VNKRLIIILSILLIPALPWMWSYLQPTLGMGLALMAWPFSWQVREREMGSLRYGYFAVGMLGMHVLLGNNLWLWLGVGSGAFFAIEIFKGKTSWLQLLMLGLLSPVVGAWMMAFSFPLRIWLSESVGKLLIRAGMEVMVQGNRFWVGGQWFEVEAACLGVSTLTLALICVPVLLGLGERKREQPFPLWEVGLWTLLAGILGVGANFGRTLWLVLLGFPAETLGHELVGLLAIGTTVLLPMMVLVKLRVGIEQGEKVEPETSVSGPVNRPYWIPLVLAVILGATSLWASIKPEPEAPVYLQELQIEGMTKFMVQKEVARFKGEESLIYVKAPTAPWRADHNPQVCWRGSGYKFSGVEQVVVAEASYMQAKLIREGDTLFTAWWYDSGQTQTSSTWEWRKRAFAGEEAFYLWNVTAPSSQELTDQVVEVLAEEK